MLRAALLMILGMSLIPLGDSAGKALTSSGVSPLFVAWTRFALGAVILLPFLRREHYDMAALRDWRLAVRALLIVGGIVSILTALRTEPIANVFGAFFVGPVVSYVLSVVLLGERVTWVRTALLGLGFVGVLLIVRPGFGMTPGLGFALLAGAFYGSYLTASRWLSSAARPRTLLLSQLVTGAVVLAPLGLLAMPPMSGVVAGLLAVSAVASMAGNLLLIVAYKLAPATRLAPLVYTQLVAAAVYGVVFFGTFPDALALAGLGLLAASGAGAFLLRR
jgi:drug/metabolite transporter (DMT)-like permease